MTRGTSSSRASYGGGDVCAGGLRRVVAVAAAVVADGEGRRFVVGRSRWLGWVAVGRTGNSEDEAAVAGDCTKCQPYVHRTRGWGDDEPVAGNGASFHNSAGLGDVGCCMPAAMVPRVAVADRNLSCSLAVAKVVVEVAEIGRSLRCMEVVELGCFEGEAGNSAILRSSRWLPC